MNKEDGDSGTLVVFLKTYEEANCTVEAGCDFTYTSSVPNVTDVATRFNTESYWYEVVLQGTEFTGTAESLELMIEGVVQETISATETEIVFKVSDVASEEFTNLEMYFEIGSPEGNELFDETHIIEPKLISISPS